MTRNRPTQPATAPAGGERNMWAAIIIRALLDAAKFNPNTKRPKSSFAVTKTRTQSEAWSWLTGYSADFAFVCALAGIDHVTLREKVLAGQLPQMIRRLARADMFPAS